MPKAGIHHLCRSCRLHYYGVSLESKKETGVEIDDLWVVFLFVSCVSKINLVEP
jgi:hypothetical protein